MPIDSAVRPTPTTAGVLMWLWRPKLWPPDCAYTASFSSLAGRNASFLLALILMASPVAGFRPIRAARFRTEDAEAGQADFVAPLQMAGGERHQIAEHGLGLLLRDLVAVGQRGGEVLECDGRLDGRFGWGRLLCSGFLGGGDWHEFPRWFGRA